jgi:hypothetical protein
MVAIVSGIGLGLDTGSRNTLGANGVIGNPGTGANGENAYVDVATGNLVLQDVDGFLAGPDDDSFADLRTYNSQGQLNGAEGAWLHAPTSSISIAPDSTLEGPQNLASSIVRTDSDGSTVTYAQRWPGGSARCQPIRPHEHRHRCLRQCIRGEPRRERLEQRRPARRQDEQYRAAEDARQSRRGAEWSWRRW